MKKLLAAAISVLVCGSVASAEDEVPWPADFQEKVAALLERQTDEYVSSALSWETLEDAELTLVNWSETVELITVYRSVRRTLNIIVR